MSSSTAFCTPLTLSSSSLTATSTSTLACSTKPASSVHERRSSRSVIVSLVDLRDADTKMKEIAEEKLQNETDPFPGPYSYLAEQANGRAAMFGFFAGLVIEVTSGVTINEQISLIATSTAKEGFLMLAPFIEIITRSLTN